MLCPMPSSCTSSCDATRRSLPRALELIVELRILELLQVERRGVLHDADADPIREQIAEQALDESRRAREQLADDDRSHLERDEHPQVASSRRAREQTTSSMISFATHRFVTGTTERDEAQHDHHRRVRRLRLPHQPNQSRHQSECGDSFA